MLQFDSFDDFYNFEDLKLKFHFIMLQKEILNEIFDG